MISALSVANFSPPDCLSAHLSVSLLIGPSISWSDIFQLVYSWYLWIGYGPRGRPDVCSFLHTFICLSVGLAANSTISQSVYSFFNRSVFWLTVFAPLGYRSICKLHELDCSYLDMFCHHQYILFYTRTGMIPQNLNNQRQENSREKP